MKSIEVFFSGAPTSIHNKIILSFEDEKEQRDVFLLLANIHLHSSFIPGGFAHIYKKTLKKFILTKRNKSNYAKYLQFLAKNQYIEINHSYSNFENNDKYPKSYKSLLANYKNETWETIKFSIKFDREDEVADGEYTPGGLYEKQFLYSLHITKLADGQERNRGVRGCRSVKTKKQIA
jgi:hypothetical protein